MRALVAALLALVLVLPRPGQVGHGAWICRGDQAVHDEPCCEHGDERDRCCTRVSAADDDVQGGPAQPSPPLPGAPPHAPRPSAWGPPPAAAAVRPAPIRRRWIPPAVGPPAWLGTHALLY